MDKNITVKYVHSGLLAESQFVEILSEIQKGNEVYTIQQNTLYSVGQPLYQLYSNVLQAYFLTNKLRIENSERQKAIELLEKSMKIEPYYMNRQLLMENYLAEGRRNKADSLRRCLDVLSGFYESNSDEDRVEIIGKEENIKVPENKRAIFYTENNIVDVGNIKQGKTTEIIVNYTNKGDTPLIITKVDGSCGCIESEWERKPILKNEKGQIKIKYYTESQGYLSKRVMIFSNALKSPSVIALKGVIK